MCSEHQLHSACHLSMPRLLHKHGVLTMDMNTGQSPSPQDKSNNPAHQHVLLYTYSSQWAASPFLWVCQQLVGLRHWRRPHNSRHNRAHRNKQSRKPNTAGCMPPTCSATQPCQSSDLQWPTVSIANTHKPTASCAQAERAPAYAAGCSARYWSNSNTPRPLPTRLSWLTYSATCFTLCT